MFEYTIKKDGKNLPENDEKVLVCFLKMLDFSAEYLNGIYDPKKIKFCPEEKIIFLDESIKHSQKIDVISKSFGVKLKNN